MRCAAFIIHLAILDSKAQGTHVMPGVTAAALLLETTGSKYLPPLPWCYMHVPVCQ